MLEKLKRALFSVETTEPWSGEMVLEAAGPGKRAGYKLASYSTVALRWVSRERGADGEPGGALSRRALPLLRQPRLRL